MQQQEPPGTGDCGLEPLSGREWHVPLTISADNDSLSIPANDCPDPVKWYHDAMPRMSDFE